MDSSLPIAQANQRLATWLRIRQTECLATESIAAIWHPLATPQQVRQCTEGPVYHITAGTVEQAIEQLERQKQNVIQQHYQPLLTEPEKVKIYEMLEIFDRQNPDYFLAYGTLLGQHLRGDLLPWDDDIDLLMPNPARANTRPFSTARSGPLIKMFDPTMPRYGNRNYTFPFIDLARCFQDGDQIKHNSVWGGVDSFPRNWIYPLRRGKFGPIECNIPANPRALLEAKYGPDCFTSALPPKWDHRHERWTKYPQVRTPLEQINAAMAA